MNENNNNSIQEWLDNLQRESWQLELLVSGFTIFLLIQVVGVLPEMFPSFNMHTNFSPYVHAIIMSFMAGAFFSSYALLVCLILHVFIRGFWIGAIGLRSVQKETDFKQLSYSTFFTKKLKHHVPSLDKVIINLDNISSVLFAFAFLIGFMFLSFALWVLFVNGISILFDIGVDYFEGGFLSKILQVIQIIFFTITLASSLIYLVDTLSLGFFKRYQFISKLYYPIYRFMGWITFAFIYRTIYYSLISRFPKNNIRILLIVFMFFIIMYPFNRITFYKYFPDFNSDSKSIQSNIYDDLRKEDDKIWSASIPSEIISDEYFPLFIRYNVKHNEVLDTLCNDYAPSKQSIWVSGVLRNGILVDPYYKEEDADKLLDCLSRLYTVQINDSTYQNLDFYFFDNGYGKEKGLRTMINTNNLPKGKNTITLKRLQINKEDELEAKRFVQFPFWLE